MENVAMQLAKNCTSVKITRIRTPESKSLKKEAPLCAKAYTHLTLYTPRTERENAREKTAPQIIPPQNVLTVQPNNVLAY